MEDGFSRAPFPPSLSNPFEPFGTDTLGRDLLSLIVLGTKDTLILVLLITVIRYAVAIPLALSAIKQKGPTFWLLTSWNSVFSALPTIFSAVILMNLPFVIFAENRLIIVILILALIEVGRVSYLIQQEGFMLSNELFVEAGITIGNSQLGLYWRYYLPALLPSIITNFFLDLGKVMLLIGQLGIFSIFIEQSWIQLANVSGELQNSSYNWASILGESRGTLRRAPWITFFPALAITFTIISFYFIGEGLRAHFTRRQ
ncbi:ABC transporter permease subunit [Anaerobacillus sp. CMMVII]|uniref:ABC transporter permease subunit n=1 Tax=Anaerobacillus sp. CMMVII TaxID=2755588 RepID=UPI0021B76112|nr:ABC transporter permease subunit [Anaerobacillus sp. CMMVII]MCT8136323.1 ABC transporter permease subunit [Anaerobacillus sp. CMMVII]